MEQVQTHITRIQTKLQDLLKKHNNLVKESELQQKTIADLRLQQDDSEKRIRILQEQQYMLKAAAGNLNEPDKKAFEQSINKYIREIDKCIALLSE